MEDGKDRSDNPEKAETQAEEGPTVIDDFDDVRVRPDDNAETVEQEVEKDAEPEKP